MKNQYGAPMLCLSGTVVRETLGTGPSSPEEFTSAFKAMGSGSVGFYL